MSTDPLSQLYKGKCHGQVSLNIHSGHLNIYFVYILTEDGHRSGPKHVVSSAQ
jgi:hypothetical protein